MAGTVLEHGIETAGVKSWGLGMMMAVRRLRTTVDVETDATGIGIETVGASGGCHPSESGGGLKYHQRLGEGCISHRY